MLCLKGLVDVVEDNENEIWVEPMLGEWARLLGALAQACFVAASTDLSTHAHADRIIGLVAMFLYKAIEAIEEIPVARLDPGHALSKLLVRLWLEFREGMESCKWKTLALGIWIDMRDDEDEELQAPLYDRIIREAMGPEAVAELALKRLCDCFVTTPPQYAFAGAQLEQIHRFLESPSLRLPFLRRGLLKYLITALQGFGGQADLIKRDEDARKVFSELVRNITYCLRRERNPIWIRSAFHDGLLAAFVNSMDALSVAPDAASQAKILFEHIMPAYLLFRTVVFSAVKAMEVVPLSVAQMEAKAKRGKFTERWNAFTNLLLDRLIHVRLYEGSTKEAQRRQCYNTRVRVSPFVSLPR